MRWLNGNILRDDSAYSSRMMSSTESTKEEKKRGFCDSRCSLKSTLCTLSSNDSRCDGGAAAKLRIFPPVLRRVIKSNPVTPCPSKRITRSNDVNWRVDLSSFVKISIRSCAAQSLNCSSRRDG